MRRWDDNFPESFQDQHTGGFVDPEGPLNVVFPSLAGQGFIRAVLVSLCAACVLWFATVNINIW